MPYLPPGFRTIDCISINPRYVAGYRLISQIKDENGNVLATYEYRQVADTTIFCAEIETPEKEGIYAIDYKIVDRAGNIVFNLYDRYLIISNRIAALALIIQAFETLTGQIAPKVDVIEKTVNRIVPWIQTRKA